MGTVNVYEVGASGSLKQVKTIGNLTTSITDLKFNPTSQMLAYSSKWKKNALRMIHLNSMTAFQNFPGAAQGILKYPFCLDFSNTSEYLAMGNDEGKAHIW